MAKSSGAGASMELSMPLVQWLEERRENALRIAETKSGDDRKGWLEDAEYFRLAIAACERVRDYAQRLAESEQHCDAIREECAQSVERRAAQWAGPEQPGVTPASIDIRAELLNEAATIRSTKGGPS